MIFSKLRVRDNERESSSDELLLFIVDDSGGGKRNDDVPAGLAYDVNLGLLKEPFGDTGGLRSVA